MLRDSIILICAIYIWMFVELVDPLYNTGYG